MKLESPPFSGGNLVLVNSRLRIIPVFGKPGGFLLLYGGTTWNTPFVKPPDNVSKITPTVSAMSNILSKEISFVIVSGLLRIGISVAVLLIS